MRIVAVAGLSQNFGALKSLITSGIQKGHMKMHLINILNTLNVNDYEKKELVNHFKNNIVSYSATEKALINLRRNEL